MTDRPGLAMRDFPRLAVRVSASSANLGPGFDCLGLALDWCDELTCEPAGDLLIEVDGPGSATVPRDASHLVVQTIEHGLRSLGSPGVPAMRLECHNTIPHSRGLGSSASAIVAGLALAWGIARGDTPVDRLWLLRESTRLEGHPDNAGASVFGGVLLAWGSADDVQHVTVRIDPAIGVRVWVPDHVVSTALARAALPAALPRARVVDQVAAAALLVHALADAPKMLLPATRDWLHQDVRRSLMPESAALIDRLRAAGVAAVVSGAGPAVLALGTAGQLARAATVAADGFAVHDLQLGSPVSLIAR